MGRAILASRAAERRAIETAIQPTLAALADLRTALREYAASLAPADPAEDQPARVAGTPAAQVGAAPDASTPGQRRTARRDAARDALQRLGERRADLVPASSERAPDETAADTPLAGVRTEAIEAIEAEARAVLDTLESSDPIDEEGAQRLRALIARIDAPAERPRYREQPPSFVFHEAPSLPPYGAQP